MQSDGRKGETGRGKTGSSHEKQRARGKLPIGRAKKNEATRSNRSTIRTGSMLRIDGRLGNDEVREKGMESRAWERKKHGKEAGYQLREEGEV